VAFATVYVYESPMLMRRQAKLDATSLLAACAEQYGAAPLSEHVSTIWEALKAEAVAPAEEGMMAVDIAAADHVAEAAARCLTRCIAVRRLSVIL
jgi:Dos2-interacting transcription regulator of RNA-Pol-II